MSEGETPPAAVPEPALVPAPAASPSGGASPFEWVLRSRALDEARAVREHRSPEQKIALARARAAVELGDRLLDPVEPLQAGPAPWLAVKMYREGVYWALAAVAGDAVPEGAESRLVGVTEADLTVAPRLRRDDLAPQTPTEAALLEPGEQRVFAEGVAAVAHAVLVRAGTPDDAVQRLEIQRGYRLLLTSFLATAALLALFFGGSQLIRKPDLTKGKAWRTSTTLEECHPAEHRCASADTDIFFHTTDEESPWVEYDLGKPTKVSSVDVKNRTDCCTERAVPMVVEVSADQKTWKEVARRTEPFTTWTGKFSPVETRFVRLRVLKRTLLHLEKVAVR